MFTILLAWIQAKYEKEFYVIFIATFLIDMLATLVVVDIVKILADIAKMLIEK